MRRSDRTTEGPSTPETSHGGKECPGRSPEAPPTLGIGPRRILLLRLDSLPGTDLVGRAHNDEVLQQPSRPVEPGPADAVQWRLARQGGWVDHRATGRAEAEYSCPPIPSSPPESSGRSGPVLLLESLQFVLARVLPPHEIRPLPLVADSWPARPRSSQKLPSSPPSPALLPQLDDLP